MVTWKQFRALQRQHAADTAEWTNRGRSVYDPDSKLVAECKTLEHAERIVYHQNFFGHVCNMVSFLAAKLKDARANSK